MTAQSLTLPQADPILRVMPMPSDVNVFGDIFGGWVMSQVDIAGGVAAMRRAKGRVATVSVNSFQFRQPIAPGDVVSFYAQVTHVGHTSITVAVQVYAQRNYEETAVVKVTEAELTFVAIDGQGRKRDVPSEIA